MINKLSLSNFRNFGKKEIEFSDNVNIIIAENASGKTNILEAIVFLSLGKSFKTRKEVEAIKYEESITSITGITGDIKLEVKITNGENGWPKKRLLINGIPKRLIDFTGNIKTVLFAPQDLDLVTSSPTLRRNFL
ncbi:MAG: AAA family ATPase, partial [bacterium]|nr:AAA family ATPase [bacterium]